MFRVFGGGLIGTWLFPPKSGDKLVDRIKQLSHIFPSPMDFYQEIDLSNEDFVLVGNREDERQPTKKWKRYVFSPSALFLLLRDFTDSYSKDFYRTSYAAEIRKIISVGDNDIPVYDFSNFPKPNARRKYISLMRGEGISIIHSKTFRRFIKEHDNLLEENKIDEMVLIGWYITRVLQDPSHSKFKAMIDFVSCFLPPKQELCEYDRYYTLMLTCSGMIHNKSYSGIRSLAPQRFPPVGEHSALSVFSGQVVRKLHEMMPIGTIGSKISFKSAIDHLYTTAKLLQVDTGELIAKMSLDHAFTKVWTFFFLEKPSFCITKVTGATLFFTLHKKIFFKNLTLICDKRAEICLQSRYPSSMDPSHRYFSSILLS